MDDNELTRILQQDFGYQQFRPGQLATIKALLAGQNALAILPTGSGKTLIYQLVGHVKAGLVVVVSPLLSLMQDQVNRFRLAGDSRVAMVSSLLDPQSRRKVMTNLAAYHYLFFSPEMITNQWVISQLQRVRIALVVVDEAHCVSEWGPDFRPHYLLLKDVLAAIHRPPTLMLTATATPQVAADLIGKLGFARSAVRVIRQSVDRPNIFLAVRQLANEDAKRNVLRQLVAHYGGRGIIYFSSRKQATQTAEWLGQSTGMSVAPYHAGIDTVNRYRIQQQFMNDQLQVICATSAFGMGIDKDDVRYVIHYHMPKSLEAYVQEIGRAGRNGQPALAMMLYCPGDEQLPLMLGQVALPSNEVMAAYQQHQLQATALGDSAEIIEFYLTHGWQPVQVRQLFANRWQATKWQVSQLLDYVTGDGCRRQKIASHFGEQLASRPALCCSSDQPDWPRQLQLPPATSSADDYPGLSWQKRLQQLFNLPAKSGDHLDSE